MDDFNLLDYFLNEVPEEVAQAHELVDSERAPYVEDYDTDTSLVGRIFLDPWKGPDNCFTVY